MTRLSKFLACCILAVVSLSAFRVGAQQYNMFSEDDTRTFHGGFVIGANFTQVDGDFTAGYNKVGLNVGPVVYAKLSPMFSASMEILYSQKGSKVRKIADYGLGAQVESYDMKLNYVEVPILLHITPQGRLHYSIGASYAYLIRSKEEAFTVAAVNLDPNLYPFRKTDINYIVGLSYHLYRNLYVNGRFAYSLFTIRDPDKVPQDFGAGNQKNNVITIKFMYIF